MARIAIDSTAPSRATGRTPLRRLVIRKIWLPRLLYNVLPWFYLAAAAAALAATIYIDASLRAVPHSLLISAACLQFGLWVLGSRRAARRRELERQSPLSNSPDA